MKLAVLLSGGKDSLFAWYRATQKEEVACCITMVSQNPESYMFHTPNIRFARLQAEAAGTPLLEYATAGEKEAELEDLAGAIAAARERYGIEGVVTGAILSVYQATRVQRICHDLGLWCFNPIWHADQEEYMQELLDEGFVVMIAGVFSAPFDGTWLGRVIDAATLEELRRIAERYHITLTGEGGEFETFVLDAPFFSKRIEIMKASGSCRNYRGVYAIEEARLVEK